MNLSAQQTAAPHEPEEHPVRNPEGFDHRVHIRDRKTGRLIRLQHYSLHIHGDEKMYEQPPGSGNMYDAGGQPMGNWAQERDGKNVRWKKLTDEHDEVENIYYANREEYLDAENKKLKEELDAIRGEQEERLHMTSHEPKNLAKAAAHTNVVLPDIPGDPGHEERVTIGEAGPKPVPGRPTKK